MDIFEREQAILDHAAAYSKALHEGQNLDLEEYDLLFKEYARLLKQLRRVTKIYDKATENLNSSKQDLLDKVHIDALTGIYNRRYLDDSLARLMNTLCRFHLSVGILMIDVDYFKRYNDTYGHSEGDECLRMVAKTISESLLRSEDFAARYGGEEFLVVLPNTDESGARVMANRILEQIRHLCIPHTASDVAEYITVSIGVTAAAPLTGKEASLLVQQADGAMYQSKKNGRNRYTFEAFGEQVWNEGGNEE